MRSVVIRMNIDEMPTACGPCELSCTAICKEWTKVDRKEIGRTKSPNCPILAILPEGHGRLADAEEMYKKSEAFCNQCRQGEHDCEKCNYIVAQGYMYKSPTIVPAERKDNGKTC